MIDYRPMCRVCKRRVDSAEYEEVHLDVYARRSKCHGKAENVLFTSYGLPTALGFAFQAERKTHHLRMCTAQRMRERRRVRR